jgi:hypothetical protein
MPINNRWKKVERHEGVYLPTIRENKFIEKNTKVCLMGSCFADEMGWVLQENGINIGEVERNIEMRHVVYPWGTFFTPLNLLNMLEVTFNENLAKNFFDQKSFIKVPKNLIGNHYESSTQYSVQDEFNYWCLFLKARLKTADIEFAKKKIDEKLKKFRISLINADVIVVTFGLIETWIDNDKKKAWHSFQGSAIKHKSIDNLAYFKLLTYEDILECIDKIIKIIFDLGSKKIIFTVSPIPLNFTFTDNDIVVANKYSKSILRAAVEKFIDNKNIFYFPSFEIVQDCVGWPSAYKKDKRHVRVEVFKEYISPIFIKHFTSLG